MIKPDGVQRGLVGEIIKRFEQKGFKLVAMKMDQTMIQMKRSWAVFRELSACAVMSRRLESGFLRMAAPAMAKIPVQRARKKKDWFVDLLYLGLHGFTGHDDEGLGDVLVVVQGGN